MWSQKSSEAGRSGIGRVLLLEFAVDVRAVAQGRFRNKSLARSAVPAFPAQVDTTKGPSANIFITRRLIGLRSSVLRDVVPERHPLPSKPTVEASTGESKALSGVGLTRSRWVAKHNLGEHLAASD